MAMKVMLGLAQISPKLGDVPANLEKHLARMEEAAAQGVQLLLFPELSLTGYYLQDMVYELAIAPSADDPTFGPLLAATRRLGLDVTVGFVEEDRRHRFFISQAYLSDGAIVHVHRKVYLPTYGMFDEGRYFAWGDSVRAFETRFGRVGMLICEDFWHASPPYLLWLDGADVLLLHSASPGRGLGEDPRLHSARWVELVNRAYASLFTDFVIHCNRVGFEDGLNFWGGSSVADPNGEFLFQGPYFEEALVVGSFDLNQLHRTRYRLPLLRDERTGLMMRELARILDNTPHGNR
ncbi:MAG: carbon-nitrogen hydrolase [Anaerolineae bacterium]